MESAMIAEWEGCIDWADCADVSSRVCTGLVKREQGARCPLFDSRCYTGAAKLRC